jgi:hypothetical protein
VVATAVLRAAATERTLKAKSPKILLDLRALSFAAPPTGADYWGSKAAIIPEVHAPPDQSVIALAEIAT